MRQLKINKSITNRSSAALDKYLVEIGREELISTDEEVELAQRIHKGDKEALERLTRANLRFVVSVAKQYQNQGLALNDLIDEGNLGLIKAAKNFAIEHKRQETPKQFIPHPSTFLNQERWRDYLDEPKESQPVSIGVFDDGSF